jgi:nucleotide-binding universal stress UspA family protein
MQELKRILLATDLEGATEATVSTAAFLARSFDSRILLLHVVPDVLPDTLGDEEGAASVAGLLDDLKARIEAEGVHVENAAVLAGKASYLICRQAEQKNVNLIVLGASQGRKTDVRLGVTAGRVLRNSVTPVWLAAGENSNPPTSILCAVDGSMASRRALDNAVRLAREFAARLTVLRVREAMPEMYARMMRPDDPTPAREVKEMRALLRAMLKDYDVGDIKVDTQVKEGVAHSQILAAVAEMKCDLIVMGAEGMSNPPRALIGSVTQKVARAMPCSILILTEEDVLATRAQAAIDSIQGRMQEAASLLEAGNPLEALAEYEQCLLAEPTYTPAWDGMALAYQALGDLNKSERCRQMAREIRSSIW